ncbi:hypothetical protein [Pendulispora albinea]|uniref:STAS domain-containing protein n=1 Tax=Pendulispora albinea TaxID=2741071 RepID=A0ABZ2LW16_9BACT
MAAAARGTTMAEYELHVEVERRTVHVRMTGMFSEAEMRTWIKLFRTKSTNFFRGRKHMIIADMRGMKTVSLPVAQLMADEIGHARLNGVVLCAHVSDDTVQRLQAARVARQKSPHDDVTVDVSSPEEAHRVISEGWHRLDDPRYTGSIRDAVRNI